MGFTDYMPFVGTTETGVRKTALTPHIIATAGFFVAYSSGVLTLTDALLATIATAETTNLFIDYLAAGLDEGE